MRTRFLSLAFLVAATLALLAGTAFAAPEAHILRIDPRASQADGSPVLTTVIELVQNKRMSDAIADCATMRGDAALDCQSERLEAPQALYSPMAPFPEQAALFTVHVEDADRPAKFVSKARWGESLNEPGVGTAWLIVVDAASTMGTRFDDAKAVALAFVSSLSKNDIVDVMFFNDRQVVADSKWAASTDKAKIDAFIAARASTYPVGGRTRSLFNIIKQAATDGFKELGNTGTNVTPPLHQAMVVISNGVAGSDASSTGPVTTALQQYLTKGRFPEDNTVLPKTPLPVISVWLPGGGMSGIDEFRLNAQEFMSGLANTEIGGFYDVVRDGQGRTKGPKIVQTVRTRFNQMHIVKWRVSCVAPTMTQTFALAFANTTPLIAGDSTFKEVPMGIDPTAWPLDVNVEYTKQMATRTPVEPDGTVRVYGDFCWGGEKDRAEIYFVPNGTPIPASLGGTNLDDAKRTQQQMIASGMRGKAVSTSETSAEFQVPDKDKILWGGGEKAVVRLVVYDNKAHRTSGVTAPSILELKGSEKQLNVLLIVGVAFGVVVVGLLVVIAIRGSGGKRRGRAGAAPAAVVAAPAPVVAGGWSPAPQAPSPYAPSPPPQAGNDFLYGGQPPQYGITAGQAPAPMPPPDPYAQGGYGASFSRATLSGAAGTFAVTAGLEVRAGRDGAQCQIFFQEPRVSGVHASLKLEGGQLWVRDERSNNGTFVSGVRVAPGAWTPVPQGAQLKFGPVELAVRLD